MLASVLLFGFGSACTGELSGSQGSGELGDARGVIKGGGDGDSEGEEVSRVAPAYQPAPGMLRRLTRAQFRNAVRDLLGVEVSTSELDPDSWNGNFAVIGAATVVTTERGVEQYHAAIESAVGAVFDDATRRAEFVGCTPSAQAGDVCVRGFIESMGLRAWRRPLETSEFDQFATLAQSAAEELGSADEGLRWSTVALLTSPNFLYRPEIGTPGSGAALRFSGYELASRLAFLVWNSLPDQQLLDEAASGALTTDDDVRSAVQRMLDVPVGREAIGAFAEEYMRLDRIDLQPKDAALFPEYGPALQAAMIRDMRGTWEAIAFDDRVSALELFSTTKVVVNAELAQLYGLPVTGLTSSTFQLLSLPADGPRVGILGKAGFLSQFANQKEGSPTLRGKFISDALMCLPVPSPPGDVDVQLDEPPEDQPMTKRDRLALHRASPSCAGCHAMMDPLGLPLETFDAIGRYRTTDHGLPIDTSGEVDGQLVADARALGIELGSNASIANCIVRKFYGYAMGHEVRDVDQSVIDALAESFEQSGYQLRELIVSTVTHQAFSSVAPQP